MIEPTYHDLIRQQQELEATIARVQAEGKAKAIENVRTLIQEHKISIRELGLRENPLKGRKVPAKYFGPNGEKWSGRGRKPLWFNEARK